MQNLSLIIILWFLPFTCHTQSIPNLELSYWLEDLDSLDQLIQNKHANPFWVSSKKEYTSILEKVKKELKTKETTDEQKIIALMQLIAATHDGHSSLRGRYDYFGYLPITFQWFGDDLHIVRTSDQYEAALGGKILSIDGNPLNKVLEKLKQVVPHSTKDRFKKFSPYYLHLPGLLYGLGMAQQKDQIKLKYLSIKGKQESITFRSMSEEEEERARFITIEPPSGRPLYRQKEEDEYWLTYLEKEQILYLKFNRLASKKDESIWQFAAHFKVFLDSLPVRKTIVDIRDNGGGNSSFGLPIWEILKYHPKVNQAGKLFVFTGFKTYSAAIQFANIVELQTKAIFVGEPIGGRPNHPGDGEAYVLPHSKTKVLLSSLYHVSTFDMDERLYIQSDFHITLTFPDFLTGNDPLLNFVKTYQHKGKNNNIKPVENIIGTYEFNQDKSLRIIQVSGELRAEIPFTLSTPLYSNDGMNFTTEVKGLNFQIKNPNSLIMHLPDGNQLNLRQKTSKTPSPWELIESVSKEEADIAFKNLKRKFPDLHSLKDHQISAVAIQLYHHLKATKGREQALEKIRNLLEIGIEINGGKAPFCKYMKRFF